MPIESPDFPATVKTRDGLNLVTAHWPSTRSSAVRVGIIAAARNREYPAVSTITGGAVLPTPTWPCPNGICAGGNHRSH